MEMKWRRRKTGWRPWGQTTAFYRSPVSLVTLWTLECDTTPNHHGMSDLELRVPVAPEISKAKWGWGARMWTGSLAEPHSASRAPRLVQSPKNYGYFVQPCPRCNVNGVATWAWKKLWNQKKMSVAKHAVWSIGWSPTSEWNSGP